MHSLALPQVLNQRAIAVMRRMSDQLTREPYLQSPAPEFPTICEFFPLQVLNERAIAVMSRMSDKLTGRDFPTELRNGADHDSIPVQVQCNENDGVFAACCMLIWHVASRKKIVLAELRDSPEQGSIPMQVPDTASALFSDRLLRLLK